MAFNGFNGNSTQFNTPQIVQNVCNTIHDTSHNLASIKMFNELRSTLMGADRILICGHSRGGIIAILLAIMCVQSLRLNMCLNLSDLLPTVWRMVVKEPPLYYDTTWTQIYPINLLGWQHRGKNRKD